MRNITNDNRPYRPFGAMEEAFYCKDPILGIDGPAGTGKSRGLLEKIHLCMEKYPGARALILRKTRESLSEAALFTFENKVVPVGHPILSGEQRRNYRQNYYYPTRSEVVIGGLDKPQKIMSTEYDLIYIQEAIECNENDVEMATTRLRNGVMPYQQLCFDCNPDKPTHWIWQKHLQGKIKLIHSRHEDNPTLWDQEKNDWTKEGVAYIATLESLTGARYERLRHGKWVAAEGVVYLEWDSQIHVVDRFDIPSDWPRYISVDFGFTNPFVAHWYAHDQDNDRLYLYREIYKTQTLVEDAATWMLDLMGYLYHDGTHIKLRSDADPWPLALICDHDAEDRATLERHIGMRTTSAWKQVSPGIQAVAQRLKPTIDHRGRILPRLMIFRNARAHEEDKELRDKSKPTCTAEEPDGYVWDIRPRLITQAGELPLKQDDHGMDATRYLIAYVDELAERKAKDVVSANTTIQRVAAVPWRTNAGSSDTRLKSRSIFQLLTRGGYGGE